MARKSNSTYLPTKLLPEQGIIWSQQRLLGLSSQVIVLLLCLGLIASVIIQIGQQNLLQERASQRYSELQSVANDLSEQLSFQRFQTLSLAGDELLLQQLQQASAEKQRRLQSYWHALQQNINDLQGIAVYSAIGQQLLTEGNDLGAKTLSSNLLKKLEQLERHQVYMSSVTFSSAAGKIAPVLYQSTKIYATDNRFLGYLVTFHAINNSLLEAKRSFSEQAAPLLLINQEGQLLANSTNASGLARMPNVLGTNLNETYPALWQSMQRERYGQFQGDTATLVYLAFQLETNAQQRDCYLISYIDNQFVYDQLSLWRYLIIAIFVVLALALSGLIWLSHLRQLLE
ncbi:cache domain-containing protein [Shewanella sp. NIFS-20-20]|uniref:cache domain-containing protein n=1 Tax=Shewanella sp. NIFS-20-20 TaxID=2853806 RepID=UPI001C46A509|nr:cache domain-containing protein [Shewanella sp. NIFS-20-20]MBV7317251.1 cache domain-containing protein [Shewanella sp. NIFS-20-20]